MQRREKQCTCYQLPLVLKSSVALWHHKTVLQFVVTPKKETTD